MITHGSLSLCFGHSDQSFVSVPRLLVGQFYDASRWIESGPAQLQCVRVFDLTIRVHVVARASGCWVWSEREKKRGKFDVQG